MCTKQKNIRENEHNVKKGRRAAPKIFVFMFVPILREKGEQKFHRNEGFKPIINELKKKPPYEKRTYVTLLDY